MTAVTADPGMRVGRLAGFVGFVFVMLVPLAYHYDIPSLHTHNLIVPKLAALRLGAVAFLISLAFRFSFEPGLLRRFLKTTWPVLAWFGWECASFIWTDYTWATTEAVIDEGCLMACALGAVLFFSPAQAHTGRTTEWRFAEITFLVCVAAAGVIFLTGRGHQPFVNENPAGTFLALAAVAALGKVSNALARPEQARQALAQPARMDMGTGEKRRVSPLVWILGAALIILSTAGVVRSRSTGAILALLGGWVVTVVVAWRRRLILLVALFIMMAAFLAAVLARPALRQAILGRRYYSTAWTRVFFWRGALDMIEERPLLGRGAGSFAPANVDYQPVESYMHKGIKDATPCAHCFYLQTAAETGAVGVLIFLGVVLFAFSSARRTLKRDPASRWFTAGILGAMSVLLLHGAVGIVMSLPTTRIFFWLCVAALLGGNLGHGYKSKENEQVASIFRWPAAMVPSACAVLAWTVFFGGEVPREIEYDRARRLFGEAYTRRHESGNVELLRLSEQRYRRATRTFYPTRRELRARIERARTLNAVAMALGKTTAGNRAEKAGYYSEAIAELRYVRALAPGICNSDMNLGFALINLGVLEGDKAKKGEGCRMLVEHLRRNPYNITEDPKHATWNIEIFRALRAHLKGAAVKRELMEILVRALEIEAKAGPDVPPRVTEAAREIRAYMEELGQDPEMKEHFRATGGPPNET